MSITIHNLRTEKPIHVYDVRVDRSSVLGNPFFMADEKQRDRVCDQYVVWLEKNKQENWSVISELLRLQELYKKHGKLRLFCWCAPKRCHAETIRENILDPMVLGEKLIDPVL